MKMYYVNNNAQSNGDHEVHHRDCPYLPLPQNSTYLGDFNSCEPAVEEAKKQYTKANGCASCCPGCNTQ